MYFLSVLIVLLGFQGTPTPQTQVGTTGIGGWDSSANGHPLTQVILTSQTTARLVIEVEERFTAALLKKDDVAFGELLSDDLLHIGFDGQVAGKTEYMAFFKQGRWRYLKYEPGDVKVKVLGSVAVVTGRVSRKIVINNQETTGAFAFTHVWSLEGDRLRLASSQLTAMPHSSR